MENVNLKLRNCEFCLEEAFIDSGDAFPRVSVNAGNHYILEMMHLINNTFSFLACFKPTIARRSTSQFSRQL